MDWTGLTKGLHGKQPLIIAAVQCAVGALLSPLEKIKYPGTTRLQHTNSEHQFIIAHWCRVLDGTFHAHMPKIRQVFLKRKNLFLNHLTPFAMCGTRVLVVMANAPYHSLAQLTQ